MKLSIITTVYKAEKELPRLLDSMMAQKSRELEFFLIDNGSPDRCGEICAEYAKKDGRFKVFTIKENVGYIRARNIAIQEVDADYVGFCDSDDYLEAGAYDWAIEKIKTTNCDLYLTSYRVIDEKKMLVCNTPFLTGYYEKDEIGTQILPQVFGCLEGRPVLQGFAWKQIFRRQILIDHKLSFIRELQPYEDQIFNIDMIRNSDSVYVDDHIIYNYIVNSESITAKLAEQFNPEEEWKRLMLFYQEKSRRADRVIYQEALANQMISFFYGLALNTTKMRISIVQAAKKLNGVIEKERVREITAKASPNQNRVNKFMIWAMCHGQSGIFACILRVGLKVRGIRNGK